MAACYLSQRNEILGDYVRRRRLDLGLSQRDVAKRVGVNKEAVRQ